MRWLFSSRRSNTPSFSQHYGVLVDGMGTLLAVSPNAAALVLLQECTPGTEYRQSVNQPNYPDPFFLESFPPESYPEWTWDRKAALFKKTKPELVTDALRVQARLVTEKARLLTRIMALLGHARTKVWTGVFFQESVYAEKQSQAKSFKESGYDESALAEFPLVVQYADFAGISIKQAADDILFKAKLDNEHLAKTEFLRLKYFNRVRDAKTVDELPAIAKDFTSDLYGAVV